MQKPADTVMSTLITEIALFLGFFLYGILGAPKVLCISCLVSYSFIYSLTIHILVASYPLFQTIQLYFAKFFSLRRTLVSVLFRYIKWIVVCMITWLLFILEILPPYEVIHSDTCIVTAIYRRTP